MPTPFFPTAYQIEVRGTYFGQLTENVWHAIGPDPFDATVAADIAGTMQVGYASIMAPLSHDYSISEIFVHNLAGVDSGEVTLAISPAQEGGSGNPGLPGNVALCVSLRTALSGRTTRGRKYFAGLDETKVTGNLLDPTTAADILDGVNALISSMVDGGHPLAIFSRTALTLTTISTATLVDLVVDSQRRRLTGRGR